MLICLYANTAERKLRAGGNPSKASNDEAKKSYNSLVVVGGKEVKDHVQDEDEARKVD